MKDWSRKLNNAKTALASISCRTFLVGIVTVTAALFTILTLKKVTGSDKPSSPSQSIQLPKCDFAISIEESSCDNHISPLGSIDSLQLHVGDFLCSNNEIYRFGMTTHKNLCLCGRNEEKNEEEMLWCAPACCDSGENPYAELQKTGNFVVYNELDAKNLKAIWSTKTSEHGLTELQLTDDGVVRLSSVNDSNTVHWSVNSKGNFSVNSQPTPNPSLILSSLLTPTSSPSLAQISKSTFPPAKIIFPGEYETYLELSKAPTPFPSESSVTIQPSKVTYFPGQLESHPDIGLKLSQGLQARIIGKTSHPVKYYNGTESVEKVHDQPDAGACFPQEDGGWIYVSNSEIGKDTEATGGVGAFRFDRNGNLLDYRMVLKNTRMNCGGGITPWGTWLSGEEFEGNVNNPNRLPGGIWEVDPTGMKTPHKTVIGENGGRKFESAACDDRKMIDLKCFATIDSSTGELRRFTPNATILENAIYTNDYSEVLHHKGTLDYLILEGEGEFHWTQDLSKAQANANALFPGAEGIDVHDGTLYFVSKRKKKMFILDLDANTFEELPTMSGTFKGQPDQIAHIIGDDPNQNSFLYFLEDGGDECGIFARDMKENKFFTILEKIANDSEGEETTGLAFCDNHKRLMFALQETGNIYEVTREDGLPFYGAILNVKYHTENSRVD